MNILNPTTTNEEKTLSTEKLADYMDRTIMTRAISGGDFKNAANATWKSERAFARDHSMIVQTVRGLAESGATIDECGRVYSAKHELFKFKIRGYKKCS